MRPHFLFALVLLSWPAVAGRGLAADPPEESVRIRVAVIFANGDGKVDDRLKCLADEVRKMHPKLTGFHVGPTFNDPIPLGGSKTFKLVDGKEATIHVKRCPKDPCRYCLEIKSNALVGEMGYTSICGKYFPLVTGYKTKDHGDQLILAFKVETCSDKEKEKK